ncbi:DUF6615 family protein [Priestia sp. YIM B13551]|uniref:DUF6615 family protein n=1 Tax=Priestia sp. YIM B13551 TaxID=3366306 RepID=UPI00366CA354
MSSTTQKLYDTMDTAKKLEIDIQEETLTELMLIDMKLQIEKFGMNTTVIHVNKNVEPKTGADFLWYIGSKKTGKFTAFYIQAKRYDGKHYKLRHKYSKPKHGWIYEQSDNLIYTAENAVGFKAIPIYCFYNFIEEDETLKRSTYLEKFPKLNIKKERFSFTYTSAYHVKSLLKIVHQKRKNGDEILRSSFTFEEVRGLPIHTLFCPSIRKIDFFPHLPGVYSSFLTSHLSLFKTFNIRHHYLARFNEYLGDELPPHIRTLMDKDSSEQVDVDDDKINARYVMVSYHDDLDNDNFDDDEDFIN